MKKIVLLFLISTNLMFSQEDKVSNLIKLGTAEFSSKKFILARDYFKKAYKIDSLNKNVLFNLAVTELELNNKKEACKILHKGYKLKDKETRNLILRFCGEIQYHDEMFAEDVDSKTKFLYKKKELPLVINSNINPKLIQLFRGELKKSKISKKKQKLFVVFNISKDGKFVCKDIKGKPEELKVEIEKLFNNITYIPSKYKGKNVKTNMNYILPFIMK